MFKYFLLHENLLRLLHLGFSVILHLLFFSTTESPLS